MAEKLIEFSRRRLEMLRDWKRLALRVKEAAKQLLPDAKVYVFGSVVEGKYTAASDIDILIVSEHAPSSSEDKARIQLAIEDALGLGFPNPNPIELHIATPEEAEWYFKALRIKYVEV